MRALRRFAALPAHERRLLLCAWLWLFPVTLCLRCFPFRWVERVFAGRLRPGPTSRLASARVVFLVSAAANRFPRAVTCLPMALVLRRLLRKEGYAAELRLGVRREGAGLDAHAWVEVDGAPVGEPSDLLDRFGALERIRPRGDSKRGP